MNIFSKLLTSWLEEELCRHIPFWGKRLSVLLEAINNTFLNQDEENINLNVLLTIKIHYRLLLSIL